MREEQDKTKTNYQYSYEMSFFQYWETYGDEEEIINLTNNYREIITLDSCEIEIVILTEESHSLILSTVFLSYFTNQLYPTIETYETISKTVNDRLIHFNEIREYRLDLSLNYCKLLPINIKRIEDTTKEINK